MVTTKNEALYRRIAQALEQWGVEPTLLDGCPVKANPFKLHDQPCRVCYDTGTVVPLQAECFWRLTLAILKEGIREIIITDWSDTQMNDVGVTLVKANTRSNVFESGTDPLDALVQAVAKSLGLEE